LVQARGLPNWVQVRRGILKKCEGYSDKADNLWQCYQKREAARRAKSWREWCKKASEKGGGRAHKWCKMAALGKPHTVPDPSSTSTEFESALPAKQLDQVMDKYDKLWEPVAEYVDIVRVAVPEALDSLDDICSAEQLLVASRSFPWKTATSYDGFHPRHWSLLGEKGLGVVAKFAGLCLALGAMPSQLNTTLSILIPKATSGFRTVGLFPSFYRILVKQQQPRVREWEAKNRHPAFSFQGGRTLCTRSGARLPLQNMPPATTEVEAKSCM